MRPIQHTISIDEALTIALDATKPIERTERVRLEDADGRVAASAVTARADVPPFDRAAMDGYAVVAADTAGAGRKNPRALRCVERVYTAEIARRAVEPGTCIEIATGAPMPQGANAVVMVEETERARDDQVRVMSPVHPGQNVGKRGADMQAGTTVVEPGTVLNPSRVGALASCGVVEVDVYARPRVAILSTGNEIVAPGHPLAPGQIYDVNRFTLSAVIGRHGGTAVPYPTAPDSLPEMVAALELTANEDIIVFSGGSSVGDRDLVLDLMRERGEVLFHGIAVKPGKPTALGRVNGRLFLGMPGYPTSCLSNGYILLVPILRRMARLPAFTPKTVPATLARRIVSAPGRHQFYTVRVDNGTAHPAFKASGDITSMSQADGYIEIPAQTEFVEAGTVVDVRLF
ncbi:MAG TPA: gephyrin-like molybdotransferase Glp [Vicinamibacterales bacterium]|jgi:molybdenum cofactor synthesis domain-containing protein|nr:gephyrin-like molybdotransferase Glp [Vicinamibacterales bacterium]